jgi:hypothetical protein
MGLLKNWIDNIFTKKVTKVTEQTIKHRKKMILGTFLFARALLWPKVKQEEKWIPLMRHSSIYFLQSNGLTKGVKFAQSTPEEDPY